MAVGMPDVSASGSASRPTRRRKIGIIGTGKMGEALVAGLLRSGSASKDDLLATDALPERRQHMARNYGITCLEDNAELVKLCRTVIIAVQPRDMRAVLASIRSALTEEHLLVSIAAGVTSGFILRELGKPQPLIRAMPNNPCLVGEGMTALAPSPGVSPEQLENAKRIFASVGRAVVAEERYFDAITGLSGSGPAYVYLMVEALADGGVRMGLPKSLALLLAAQTMLGSAKMVLSRTENPAKLRDEVVTPAGTTAEGIYELEKAGVRAALMTAVEKATLRAASLAST
ncbi:MAG: pyrroline-5-carboxylate reductase [Candidatus Bathyarchaeia archaeon]